MAHLDKVSSDSLQSVARAIGKLVDENLSTNFDPEAQPPVETLTAAEEGPKLTIAETLTVWKLTAPAFKALEDSKLSGDLVAWVEPTSLLYHQIKLNGDVQGFAHSYIDDAPDAETILNVDASPFASKLAGVLERVEHPEKIVDNHERDDRFFALDPVVRLLEIPACRIFALWLFVEPNQSRVIIINATAPRSEFEGERILTSDQFFKALSIYRPIEGVG